MDRLGYRVPVIASWVTYVPANFRDLLRFRFESAGHRYTLRFVLEASQASDRIPKNNSGCKARGRRVRMFKRCFLKKSPIR